MVCAALCEWAGCNRGRRGCMFRCAGVGVELGEGLILAASGCSWLLLAATAGAWVEVGERGGRKGGRGRVTRVPAL